MRVVGRVAVLAAAVAGVAGVGGVPARAASVPGVGSLVAYVRSGDVYVSKGAAETRVATGGGWSRPRWSPNGKLIAAVRGGQLWTMKADGSAKRRITTRAAGGPSWSPDGTAIAFASQSCSGGPGVYRISATAADAVPEVLFPAYCRGEELPAEPVAQPAATGSLSERLRWDDAVAWSPDGTRIAFRGGDCESVYDACLTVGTVATGGEKTVAAYGGGSLGDGFAAVPAWRGDGAKLAWTAAAQGENEQPVHVVEYDTANGAKRDLGAAQDRELAYVNSTSAVVTSTGKGGSWITVLNTATGARAAFHQGSQPSVQPKK
ncbi:PD40 domain-containing protein [Actinoplanes sp. N902-109]|uniref:PD40 domain-containing protein n=1 Tax=Actinoplanes sp. (strain N902-109) TaxID=649831 RepID=UPI00032955FF|nr:PD40 domain-containing protein [Actinoplanes sp. N902-109]AGL19695.1 serine/threonine protein kinase [Actinoplanes sp. N902-109]